MRVEGVPWKQHVDHIIIPKQLRRAPVPTTQPCAAHRSYSPSAGMQSTLLDTEITNVNIWPGAESQKSTCLEWMRPLFPHPRHHGVKGHTTDHSVSRHLQPPWGSLGLASLFTVAMFLMYTSRFQASGTWHTSIKHILIYTCMLLWGNLESVAIIVSLDLVLWAPCLSQAHLSVNLPLRVIAYDPLAWEVSWPLLNHVFRE